MKASALWHILVAAVLYLVLFLLGSTSGLIHPACYAYAGTFFPILSSFIYFYTASRLQRFGAAAILNGFVLVIALIVGEGNTPLIFGLIILAVLAEIVRKLNGYHSLKGARLSFIPLAFSFYTYTAHWWTDTEGSLEAAVEEMPAGYADKMIPVIDNIPLLIIMLILVIPAAIIGMRLAEKIMRKTASSLK